MIDFSYWRGALLAMLCAGPVFLLPLLFISIASNGGESVISGSAISGSAIRGLAAVMGISILFGAVIAFLPVFFGGYLMGLWGSRDPRARHPALWGLAGVALATPIGFVLTGLERGDPRFWALFAFTGGVCALLVRLGTRWDDEPPPAPTHNHEGEVK